MSDTGRASVCPVLGGGDRSGHCRWHLACVSTLDRRCHDCSGDPVSAPTLRIGHTVNLDAGDVCPDWRAALCLRDVTDSEGITRDCRPVDGLYE